MGDTLNIARHGVLKGLQSFPTSDMYSQATGATRKRNEKRAQKKREFEI